MADRITELRIEGLRTIEKLVLPLDGLTVLIGENGSGKSSIIEACQILRAAAGREFLSALHGTHGGPSALFHWEGSRLKLGVQIEGDGAEPRCLRYEIALDRRAGEFAQIEQESLVVADSPEIYNSDVIVSRAFGEIHMQDRASDLGPSPRSMPSSETALATPPADAHPAHLRMLAALAGIEVHLPFDVLPDWAGRTARRSRTTSRGTLPIQHEERVSLLGDNLANVYFRLNNDREWSQTMDYVRLGLGQHIENVMTFIDPGGGKIGLQLKVKGHDRPMPTSALSDGELAYLAYVGIFRLGAPRSLLAFDEPDLHLHPGLLARVVQLFEAMGEHHPVVLATQSDSLLDALSDPVKAVRVCELEQPDRRTRVRSLDRSTLEAWLRDYRGVGHVRADGLLPQILADE